MADSAQSDMADIYQYGCMFCVAEGRSTAAHERLEHLWLHIVSKHRTAIMTSQVREKTKCVIGSMATQAENWDINVPESSKKGAGVATDEILFSASKLFSWRKNKR